MSFLDRVFAFLDRALNLGQRTLIVVGWVGGFLAWGWLTWFCARGLVLNFRDQSLARSSTSWRSGTGTVIKSQVVERQVRKRQGYGTEYDPEIRYRYRVGGRDLEGWRVRFLDSFGYSDPSDAQADVTRFPVGATVGLWYDPDHPERVTLLRESGPARTATNVIVGILLVVLLLGGAVGVTVIGLRVAAAWQATHPPTQPGPPTGR